MTPVEMMVILSDDDDDSEFSEEVVESLEARRAELEAEGHLVL